VEWISSLNALVRTQPVDLSSKIMSEALRLRSTRLLHLGVTLADQLSPCPETQRLLKLLTPDPVVKDMARSVWSGIFAEEISGWAKEVHRLRFYMRARERVLDRLRLVWMVSVRIPPPQSDAWKQNRLPDSLLFFFYFRRPIALLRKVGLRRLLGVLRT